MEQLPTLCIGDGNMKLGRYVPTFSLPSKTTCPGASDWCLANCYAARYERLRPNCRSAYERNLAISRYPVVFMAFMMESLPAFLPLLRIHVSGDFYSREYVDCWREIIASRPRTNFWAYTRSWVVSKLVEPLERLSALPNMHLFASTDETMPIPPDDWPVAFVDNDSRAAGMPCKHQYAQADSCLDCGHCFTGNAHHVVFKAH